VKCFFKDGSPRTRACSSSAKEERHAAILKAAAHLFSVREYREVSIGDVAHEAGLAKGTVYLYFKTKETLFLELCANAFRDWFDALDAGFPEKSAGPAALAAVIASTLRDRPLLRRLFALLHSVFEENVDDSSLRAFKQQMAELLQRPALRTEQMLNLKSGEGLRIMLWTHALMVGLVQMTSREESSRRLIAKYPELELMRLDFNRDFEAALASMLTGCITVLA